MRFIPPLCVAVFTLAAGCPRRASPPPTPARPAPVAQAADASVAPAPVPITDAEVRALLDAWTGAQNRGDFAAYEALYASRFYGVRRSGPAVARFDRAGWLRDRRRMFDDAMHVEARDLTVPSTGAVATVRFTQEFASGRYHDVGPKEITVVRVPGGLRIAREEMLASTIRGAVASGGAPAPGSLMNVIEHAHARWAVIAAVPEGADWHEGTPELVERGVPVVTRANVRAGAVPEALRALDGAAVQVVNASGASCPATLRGLSILSRVDVHFGVAQRWDGQDVDGSRVPRATPRQIAREAWGEGMLLAARVESPQPCEGVAARVTSLPAAPVFARSEADADLARRALERFRAMPAWRALQEGYHGSEGAPTTPWDEHDHAHPAVHVWSAPGGARRFVTVSASVMVGGCAEFSGSLWAVFEANGSSALTLHTDPAEPGYQAPTAAVDIDGDGAPEFVVPDGIVRKQGTVYRLTESIAFPSHDCPC